MSTYETITHDEISKLIKTIVLSLMEVERNLISRLDVLLSNNKLRKQLQTTIERNFKRDLQN